VQFFFAASVVAALNYVVHRLFSPAANLTNLATCPSSAACAHWGLLLAPSLKV